MKKLYIIRHGQTDWNKQRILQGRTDICLNEQGRAQAKELRMFFKHTTLDKVYVSPLKRAKETAEILVGDQNLPLEIEERLIERSFGEAEGGPFSRYLTMLEEDGDIKGLESKEAMLTRVTNFLEDILQDEAKEIMLISHGVTIQVLHEILEIPFDLEGPSQGIVFEANIDKKGNLLAYSTSSIYE